MEESIRENAIEKLGRETDKAGRKGGLLGLADHLGPGVTGFAAGVAVRNTELPWLSAIPALVILGTNSARENRERGVIDLAKYAVGMTLSYADKLAPYLF